MTVTRGTSNSNDRGSAEQRRRRKQWLFEVWAADVDVLTQAELVELVDAMCTDGLDELSLAFPARMLPLDGRDLWLVASGLGHPAVRCFRCGCLLRWDEVEIDRIKPGCEGGRYARNNIRPSCSQCNHHLGELAKQRKREKRLERNRKARERRAAAKGSLEALAKLEQPTGW